METINYPYKPKPILMVFVMLFFGVCAVVLGNIALNNSQGLVLNGVIRMGVQAATIFYAVLTILALLFVLIGIIGFIRGLQSPKEIVLTDSYISAPKNTWAKQNTTIDYNDIFSVDTQVVSGQHFFNIHHLEGKLTINRSMLPNKKAFDSLIESVIQKVQVDVNV